MKEYESVVESGHLEVHMRVKRVISRAKNNSFAKMDYIILVSNPLS